MNFIADNWILIPVIGIVCYGLWSLVGGIAGAFVDIKKRPREDMYWCSKHGYFRRKHVLPIEGITEVCPICFKQAWDKAGQ